MGEAIFLYCSLLFLGSTAPKTSYIPLSGSETFISLSSQILYLDRHRISSVRALCKLNGGKHCCDRLSSDFTKEEMHLHIFILLDVNRKRERSIMICSLLIDIKSFKRLRIAKVSAKLWL